MQAAEQPIPDDQPIPDGLRKWAYASFKAIGVDLALTAQLQPEFMSQIDWMVRAWNNITLQGADFGVAAIIVMETIERNTKPHANNP